MDQTSRQVRSNPARAAPARTQRPTAAAGGRPSGRAKVNAPGTQQPRDSTRQSVPGSKRGNPTADGAFQTAVFIPEAEYHQRRDFIERKKKIPKIVPILLIVLLIIGAAIAGVAIYKSSSSSKDNSLASDSGDCIKLDGKCGGKEYDGPTCCIDDTAKCYKMDTTSAYCKVSCPNDWLCAKPEPTDLPTSAPSESDSGNAAGDGEGGVSPGRVIKDSLLTVAPAEKLPTANTQFAKQFDLKGTSLPNELFADYCPDRATMSDGTIQLAMDKKCGTRVRTKMKFSTVKFSAKVKAAVGKGGSQSGVVSAFYSSSALNDDNSKQNEVDFEWLGRSPNVIQTNYYLNGVGKHEAPYTLPFDTTEDFHEYGVEITNKTITWFVDGVAIRIVQDISMVARPQYVLTSLWDGSDYARWAGEIDYSKGPYFMGIQDLKINGTVA